jgi:hypothetical protein
MTILALSIPDCRTKPEPAMPRSDARCDTEPRLPYLNQHYLDKTSAAPPWLPSATVTNLAQH